MLYLERPPDNSAQLHALRRALRIQRLEGSRPHGGLCTLNGSDRAQQVKPFALVGRICGFDGWIDGRSRTMSRQEVAEEAGGRAVLGG